MSRHYLKVIVHGLKLLRSIKKFLL